MIELYISSLKPNHQKLKQRFQEMTLAGKIIEKPYNSFAVLKEGNCIQQGYRNVNKALDKLAEFKDKWYECTCDKYEWLEN